MHCRHGCKKTKATLSKVLGRVVSQDSTTINNLGRRKDSPHLQPNNFNASSLTLQKAENMLNNMFGEPISWANLEVIVRPGPTEKIQTFSLAVAMYRREMPNNCKHFETGSWNAPYQASATNNDSAGV